MQQVDHVGIQADTPRALFEFFTGVLGLPVAFPYTEYPGYSSGSVVLGNIFLEIMRFGSSGTLPRTPSAHYHILGFLARPGTLAGSPAELERRDVPHSGLVPFFAPEPTDEKPVAIWDNVYLGGLFGWNAWMRLFFAMTKRARPKPSLTRSPLLNAMSLGLMARAFRNGMPVLTDYYRENDDAKRESDWEALRRRQGGGLGVECVHEVAVALPAHEPRREVWERLLAPRTLDLGNRFTLDRAGDPAAATGAAGYTDDDAAGELPGASSGLRPQRRHAHDRRVRRRAPGVATDQWFDTSVARTDLTVSWHQGTVRRRPGRQLKVLKTTTQEVHYENCRHRSHRGSGPPRPSPVSRARASRAGHHPPGSES